MSVDSVFSEGAISVATVELKEKSVPVQIRESLANGKLYLQHARQLRQKHEAEASQRESDHQRLIAAGSGPVSGSEVQKLQQSRWAILQANEDSLRELIRELQNIVDDRTEQYTESQRLVQQYHADGIERLMRDFGLSKSNADARMGADRELQSLRQQSDDIRQQGNAVRQMIAGCEDGIRAIAESRANLSRKWRTF